MESITFKDTIRYNHIISIDINTFIIKYNNDYLNTALRDWASQSDGHDNYLVTDGQVMYAPWIHWTHSK